MKKFILFIFSFSLLYTCDAKFLGLTAKYAKEVKCVKKGTFTASLGYGAPSILRTFLKENTPRKEYNIHGSGPYIFKADYFITNKWSIGTNLTFSQSNVTWMDKDIDTVTLKLSDFKYTIRAKELTFTIRGNYHFKRTEKLDIYAGLGFGTGKIKISSFVEPKTSIFSLKYQFPNPTALEATLGASYYIKNNFGIYSEIGLGKLWIVEFFDKRYYVPDAIIQFGCRYKFQAIKMKNNKRNSLKTKEQLLFENHN